MYSNLVFDRFTNNNYDISILLFKLKCIINVTQNKEIK